MKHSIELYDRTAKALNVFYDSWTARYCRGCFKLCKESYPDDEFASMELAEGVFPGCCQAGVAEDFRIMDLDEPLPEPFVAAIREARREFLAEKMIVDSADTEGSRFVLLDKVTGKLKNGVGCKWLGEGGCKLEQWKSPICLAFVCEPVRRWLSVSSDGDQWPLERDFCGVSRSLESIGTAYTGKREHYGRALGEVEELERRLTHYSARLEDVSGVSQ